ncbi:MAG: hypothetical protein AAF488_04535 [Planctomycetota bacterium]
MPDIPFAWRIGALLLISVIAVALDQRRPPEERNRWREYSVLLLCTSLGIAVGIGIDRITVSISPEYFLYGKGIPDGPGFLTRVLLLGAQAGASAGAIGGAVLLIVNRQPHQAFKLLPLATLPIVGALLLGVAFGLTQHFAAPVTLEEADELLAPEAATKFILVWVIHVGIYSGAALGLIVAALRLRGSKRIAIDETRDSAHCPYPPGRSR